MSDTPYYVPSYLEDSGSDNFKRFADTMPHVGPLRFRDCTSGYSIRKADIDWVLRFKANSDVVLPADPESANDRIPVGAQIAVMSLSYGRVKVTPASGVTITTQGGRAVVDSWKIGILTKTGDNTWSFAAPSRGSGGSTVPLPPTLTSAAGITFAVALTWNAPSDDGGSAITGYTIESSTDQINWNAAGSTDPNVRSKIVDSLNPETTYYFRLRAVNSVGSSEPSNVMSATTAEGFNEATGGTVTEYMSGSRRFRVHTFTGDGELTIVKNPNQFRVLAAAGGSGGTGGDTNPATGAGGGTGGEAVEQNLTLDKKTYPVTVGKGGAGGGNGGFGKPNGSPGTDTSFASLTLKGGVSTAGSQSSSGGPGLGGASSASGQTGGAGIQSDISGVLIGYGGGGGSGGIANNSYGETPGSGADGGGRGGKGTAGGGNGPWGDDNARYAWNGRANTGGGGGGGCWRNGDQNSTAGNGADGVVVVSYEIAPFNEATGGQISDVENYNGTGQKWRVHRFTGNDTLTVTRAVKPFKVLVVAAGGSSGVANSNGHGGGGGGGGCTYNENVTLSEQAYPVVVGQGTPNRGGGGSSSVAGISTVGGGPGGSWGDNPNGGDGGSGGGPHGGATAVPGNGIAGQGFKGGDGQGGGGNRFGGGGGSAGGPGSGNTEGPGRKIDITGALVEYARGGGSWNQPLGAPPNYLGYGAGTGGYPGGSGIVVIAYQIG